jgi:hypothetical protein
LNPSINRTVEKNFSLKRVLRPEDEWCAEAYMETDYGQLTKEDFINEVKKYAAFNILNK